MSSGTRRETTTSTQTAAPDPLTQQMRQDLFARATAAANQGMPAYYPGQTVAPFSFETGAALDQMTAMGMQPAPFLGMGYGAAARNMSGAMPGFGVMAQAAMGGMNNPFMAGLAGIGGQSSGFGGQIAQTGQQANPFTQQIAQTGQQANPFVSALSDPGQVQAGVDALQQTASGQMLANNPFLAQMYSRGANQIQNQVDSAFRRAGMQGTAQYAGALGDSLSGLYSDIYAPAYAQERQAQLSAANALAGVNAADLARRQQGLGMAADLIESGTGRSLGALNAAAGLSAQDRAAAMQGFGAADDSFARDRAAQMQGFGAAAGLFGEDAQRRMAGAGSLFDMFQGANQAGLRGLSALPGLFDYGMMPTNTLGQAGAMIDAQNQALIDADRQRYDYNANAERNNIGWLANMYNGLPSDRYGTTTGTQEQLVPRQNPFMTALGVGAGLAGIGSGLFGPMGMMGAGGFFSPTSDPRRKKNAKLIGEDPRGVRWWTFHYNEEDDDAPLRFGVMADELEKIAPQFVFLLDGFRAVDYAGLAAWRG
jgi:hypothetical protein